MRNSFKGRFNGNYKILLIAIILYSILLGILYKLAYKTIANQDKFTLFGIEFNYTILESYLASSTDNIIFFATIGLILFVVSKVKPEDEDILKKIHYIFPEASRNTPLSDHIKEQIGALACVATKSVRYIDLNEVSQCGLYIKVSIKSESHLKNIYHNEEYIDDKIKFHMAANPVDFTDLWGEVSEAYITATTDKLPEDNNNLEGTKELIKGNASYTKLLKVKILPSKGAIYKTSGWCWQKKEESFGFSVNRFTESQAYRVRNKSSQNIRVTFTSNKIKLSPPDLIVRFFKKYIPLDNKKTHEIKDEDDLRKKVLKENKIPLEKITKVIAPDQTIKLKLFNITPDDKFELNVHRTGSAPDFESSSNDIATEHDHSR